MILILILQGEMKDACYITTHPGLESILMHDV